VAPPTRRGFGYTLLERVTGRELGGQVIVEFRPDGIRATLTADATALASGGATREAANGGGPAPSTPSLVDAERPRDTMGGESVGDGGDDDIAGVKVLIVEDAVLLALELEAGLTDAGARVVGVAADLNEAERMLGLAFDVAVLDANLNGRSVLPVARMLAARGTPFIFATGYDEAGVAPEGFHAPVVRKPYNVRQIATALVQALAAR
jgi:CheY-like chemotaxis protein